MKKYLNMLTACPLFIGIEEENLLSMLNCIGAKIVNYKKWQVIISEGDFVENIGIVLDGGVLVSRVDYYGNKSILTTVKPSYLFAETFACAKVVSPVSAVATEDSIVLMVRAEKIVSACSNACEYHNKMVFNLLKAVADKNIVLNNKMEVTSKRTTREKLLAYLAQQARFAGSNVFTIPFDRQALADYLEVDRSGLSVEISKLVKEGVILNRKSRFTLL